MAYRRGVDSEARSRLGSVLDVCAHEARSLERLNDPRLDEVLKEMAKLRAEIVATLATLATVQPPASGGDEIGGLS